MTATGREEPFISEILTTALEKLLPTFDDEFQILIIHPPLPGNFPKADVHKSNCWGWIRPGAAIQDL